MADEDTTVRCTSIEYDFGEFEGETVTYCWEETNPYPMWDPDEVTTGLRPSIQEGARGWRTCQYFLELPPLCVHWNSSSRQCEYIQRTQEEGQPSNYFPTGFNNAQCDYLGRRVWCDRYEPAGGDIQARERVCAAPNMFLTGLGKFGDAEQGIDYYRVLLPVSIEEIKGYNSAGDGIGRCDCYGMGRGQPGCQAIGEAEARADDGEMDYPDGAEKEKILNKLPVICNYYRPYSLSLGGQEPQRVPRGLLNLLTVNPADPLGDEYVVEAFLGDYFTVRLPINFIVYNLRATLQRCQWWANDTGSQFSIITKEQAADPNLPEQDQTFVTQTRIRFSEEATEGITPFDPSTGRLTYCTHGDDEGVDVHRYLLFPPNTPIDEMPGILSERVLALDGSIICNGAKAECPGYSGKWVYCVDEKMRGGMAVTAEQIMELRFWVNDFETRDVYEDYFSEIPNRAQDPPTTAIYTFDRWDTTGSQGASSSDPTSGSRMKGKKVDLCVPVPFHFRDFSRSVRTEVLLKEPVTYAPHNVQQGTVAADSGLVNFPCLIRNPYVGRISVLEVVYPYKSEDVWAQVPCIEGQGDRIHTRWHYKPEGIRTSVVGWATPNKVVYAINASYSSLSESSSGFSSSCISAMVDLRSSGHLREPLRLELSSQLSNIIDDLEASNPDFVAKTTSNPDFGYFVIDSIKLPYGTNEILVIVANADGTYDFEGRSVRANWSGCGIFQTEFNDNEPSSPNRFPFSFNPPASIKIKEVGLSPDMVSPDGDIIPVYHTSRWVSGQNYRYYSYYIKKIRVGCDVSTRFVAVGNSNVILVYCNDSRINILFKYEFVSAQLVSTVYGTVDLKQISLSDISVPPGVIVLKPTDSNIRRRWLPSEVESVSVVLDTYEFVSGNPEEEGEDVEIVSGAGSSELDLYRAAPYSINSIQGSSELDIPEVTNSVARVLGIFWAAGKPVCAFATKLLVKLADVRCRNVDIFYRYGAYTQAAYVLTPTSGFCIPPLGIENVSTVLHLVETPRCADHEYSDLNFKGPLWYPFNKCQKINMYKEFTGANFCAASYVGPENSALIGTMPFQSVLGGTYQIQMRDDYRYCGPHERAAWAVERSALQACGCGWVFYYGDAASATVHFMGKARIRGPIDVDYYREQDWDLPPFGNDGTELAEKFISHDYLSHFTQTLPPIRSEWMPMVMDHSQFVMSFNAFEDHDVNIDYALGNNKGDAGLVFTNMMNFLVLPEINESTPEGDVAFDTNDNRYTFDELFDVEYEGNSSYPPPTIQINDNSTANNFYKFKDENVCWAWQEYWVPIQRNVAEGGNLDFISWITLPPYMYSLFKEEHKMSPDEGVYSLTFAVGGGEEIGAQAGICSIKIGDGPIRAFKTIYAEPDPITGLYEYDDDVYDNTQIVWVEGNQTNVSSNASEEEINDEGESSEDDEDYFYYGAVDEDEDYVFEDLSVDEFPDANYMDYVLFTNRDDYEIITEYDYQATPKETTKKYKEHVKIFIPKSRLDFLPKVETANNLSGSYTYQDYTLGANLNTTILGEEVTNRSVRGAINASYIWGPLNNNLIFTPLEITQDATNGYVGRIRLIGKKGIIRDPRATGRQDRFDVIKIDKPGISFVYSAEYGADIVANNPELAGQAAETGRIPRGWSSSVINPETVSDTAEFGLEDYEIDIRLPVGPIELTTGVCSFVLTLTCALESYIAFDFLTIYGYNGPIGQTENIKIYERKYRISTFNQTPSLDGPQDLLHYNQDLYNSGQYFKFKGRLYNPNEEIDTANKLREVACGPYYEDSQAVAINMDNLKDVEKNEQKELYEDALERFGAAQGTTQKISVYEAFLPPAIKPIADGFAFIEFETPEQGGFPIPVPFKLTMTVTATEWDDHYLQQSFIQYDFWRPGGHSYSWSSFATNELCRTNGETGLTFYGAYNHHGHTGINAPGAPADIGVDTSRSYYSTRFYATEALYQRFMILSGGREPDAGFDLLTAANLYNSGRTPGGNNL